MSPRHRKRASASGVWWREAVVPIATQEGTKDVAGHVVDGWPLVLTPNVNSYTNGGAELPERGYVITHVQSGRAVWPNVFPLDDAKRIVAALIALDGWDRPYVVCVEDAELRARAEAIVCPPYIV